MRTVDSEGNEIEIETHGRHDPCVGIRAVPVGEAMMACVLADHLLRYRAIGGAGLASEPRTAGSPARSAAGIGLRSSE